MGSKRGAQGPVHIRRNLDTFSDPYLAEQTGTERSVCTTCDAVYQHKRWYIDMELTETQKAEANKVLCPACKKIGDGLPGGVVTLEGTFLKKHKEEIIHLIQNEEKRARGFNPLERIIEMHGRSCSLHMRFKNSLEKYLSGTACPVNWLYNRTVTSPLLTKS